MPEGTTPVTTPDGRYIVVRGRLWRASNPSLPEDVRQGLVNKLMHARRAVKDANGNRTSLSDARHQVNQAKIALGERGPVWWNDGEPDLNKRLVENTVYAAWYRSKIVRCDEH